MCALQTVFPMSFNIPFYISEYTQSYFAYKIELKIFINSPKLQSIDY